jgi:uncharacterized membrane protein YcaP (DUF421 family)
MLRRLARLGSSISTSSAEDKPTDSGRAATRGKGNGISRREGLFRRRSIYIHSISTRAPENGDNRGLEESGMPHWLATHEMWNAVFGMGAPVAEKTLRAVLVYGALVLFLRVFGKRELAQLNPFDLVVLLSLSNTVQNAIIGNDNSLTGGLLGAFTLLAVNYLVVRFLFRHRRLDEIFEGEPTVLIDHGQVDNRALAKELLSRTELLTVLHRQGFTALEDVERCVLEPGGTFAITAKAPPADETRHNDLVRRLEELSGKVDRLQRQQA